MRAGKDQAEIIVCGAGIAGIASAYYLAVRYGRKDIILIDRDQPMSYTTAKSGENYRDYWPQECMASFARRSISLMEALAEENNHCFEMHRFGYQFVSLQQDREIFPSAHLRGQADTHHLSRICGAQKIHSQFPYLADTVSQLVHIKEAGALDVYALGSLMLSLARKAGVRLHKCHVDNVSKRSGKFQLSTQEGRCFESEKLVLAAGPMVPDLAGMLGVEMNIQSWLQRKFVIPDPDGIIPRDMPFTIFADPQFLDWSEEEREMIGSDDDYRYLLDEFPAGLHIKPESGNQIKLGWAYNRQAEQPTWQPADDFDFPNIVMRGASRFIPGLSVYVDKLPTPVVQFSGYYTRTPENWPVIGPLAAQPGLYTIAALSGYGTMTGCAAGELVASWVLNEPRPDYAGHFHPERYQDPKIMTEINAIESDGQL